MFKERESAPAALMPLPSGEVARDTLVARG